MKRTKIIYWISTILFAGFMLFSAIPDIMNVPEAKEMVSKHLGYPVYLIPFLGVAKLLGAIAILVPGFPRIKEWAYAGLTFDLIGAWYSSIAVGDPPAGSIFMILILAVEAVSYIYHHKKLNEASLSKAK